MQNDCPWGADTPHWQLRALLPRGQAASRLITARLARPGFHGFGAGPPEQAHPARPDGAPKVSLPPDGWASPADGVPPPLPMVQTDNPQARNHRPRCGNFRGRSNSIRALPSDGFSLRAGGPTAKICPRGFNPDCSGFPRNDARHVHGRIPSAVRSRAKVRPRG